MLIEFSVENFLSFKDKVTLSMVASKDHELEDRLIKTSDKELRLNKVGVIYGANASGKSNLIKAMLFMQRYVVLSMMDIEKRDLRVVPFKLDLVQEDLPSEFEIIFMNKGVKYSYGFALDKRHIKREWLHSYPKTQRRLLFDRHLHEMTWDYEYTFGSHWEGEKNKIKPLVRPDALFISVAAGLNNPLATIVLDFFRNMTIVTTNEIRNDVLGLLTRKLLDSQEAFSYQVMEFLKAADLGIKGIKRQGRTPLSQLTAQYLGIGERVKGALEKEYLAGQEDPETPDIFTIHQAIDKEGKPTEVLFSLSEESDGTQKLFKLSAALTVTLLKGSVLVIDELDAQVHSLITKGLLMLFQSKQNSANAQLVISTHDTSLLDEKILRRDQIYFTEKDKNSSSQIYSLFEFKPRKGENFRRGYLDGRYGGIPFLSSSFTFDRGQEETEGKVDEQKESN